MDAVDVLKVCLRRWYVMLPILIGAAGVSYQLLEAEQTTFTASASYGLVQPAVTADTEDETSPNPLGDGGNALVGAAIEAQLNAKETQQELGSDDTRGWGPGQPVNHRSYDVAIPQFETTYEVRAWSEDEAEVRRVVDRVIAAAPDIADELQVRAGVPPPQRYQPFVLAPTQVEALPATSGAKLVIAVMGVGLLMGAAWSIVVDRWLRWRAAHRQAVRLTDEAPEPARVAGPDPAPSEEAEVQTHAPPPVVRPSGSTSRAERRRANAAKAGGPNASAARTNGVKNNGVRNNGAKNNGARNTGPTVDGSSTRASSTKVGSKPANRR